MILYSKKLETTGRVIWEDTWNSNSIAIEEANGKVREAYRPMFVEAPWWRKAWYTISSTWHNFNNKRRLNKNVRTNRHPKRRR